jgi:hypothetical protein
MKRQVTKKYGPSGDIWWNYFIGDIFEVVTHDRDNYQIVESEIVRIWERIPSCRKYDKFLLDKRYCRVVRSKRAIRTVRKL